MYVCTTLTCTMTYDGTPTTPLTTTMDEVTKYVLLVPRNEGISLMHFIDLFHCVDLYMVK